MSYGGASNKNMKKWPRILDYLQVNHPEVYAVIDDLAMHGSLTPRRGGAITFLLPDSQYLAEIKKALESESPEKATDMVSALILTDLLESAKDFSAKTDIANLLGNKLVVKSVTGSKVLIEDGELTPDTKFKPFERQGSAKRGNMAVWLLKGSVKLDTPKASSKMPRAAKKGGRRGGADMPTSDVANPEALLAEKVREIENSKRAALVKDEKDAEGRHKCPMAAFVCRVLCSFKEHNRELYKRARSIYVPDAFVMFYLLARNPDIFPYADVWHCYSTGADPGMHADYMKNFCAEDLRDEKDAALVLSHDGQNSLTQAHQEAFNRVNISKKAVQELLEVYDEVNKTNQLSGVGPVYPEELAQIFRSKPKMHLLLDEAAWWLYTRHQDCNSPDPKERAQQCSVVMNDFHAVYGDLSYSENKVRLGNEKKLSLDIDHAWINGFVVDFMRTFALRVPCQSRISGAMVGGDDDDEDDDDDDPYDPTPRNIHKKMGGDLDKLSNADSELSPQTLCELRAWVRKHGNTLPPSVTK